MAVLTRKYYKSSHTHPMSNKHTHTRLRIGTCSNSDSVMGSNFHAESSVRCQHEGNTVVLRGSAHSKGSPGSAEFQHGIPQVELSGVHGRDPQLIEPPRIVVNASIHQQPVACAQKGFKCPGTMSSSNYRVSMGFH